MFIYRFCTVYKEPLKPMTTVSIDDVLPKIDLEIEHVLIGVENRSRFCMTYVPKFGSDF